jgi:lysophospholipase L1-like esterase
MRRIIGSHFITALLSVALLASVVLNLILFTQSRQYYLQLNETRLDPLGLSSYSPDSLQNAANPDKAIAVFFGDSRAADWPPPDLASFEFVNRGIGAQTSAQALQRFDYHVKPLHPRVVLVQVGINDLKTVPLFPERKRAIIAGCEENIRHIVTQSVDGGATVVLTTIFPTGEVPLERQPFWSPDVAQAVSDVNTYIRSLQAQDVIVLDAYSILSNESGMMRDEYAQDMLHLNAAGYAALNEHLMPILSDKTPGR